MAKADYQPSSHAWNGLFQFAQLAYEQKIKLKTLRTLTPATLSETQALIVFSPRTTIPQHPVHRWIKQGGRLVIMDDVGKGQAFLKHYGIHRASVPTQHATHLRYYPSLRLAFPTRHTQHALLQGVETLITNHPRVLTHKALKTLFAYSPTSSSSRGLVFAGSLDQGRLVAISDPSMVINLMMQFSGNVRFARNLLTYLSKQGSSTIGIVLPNADWRLGSSKWATLIGEVDALESRFDSDYILRIIGVLLTIVLLTLMLWRGLSRASKDASQIHDVLALPQPSDSSQVIES